MAGQNARVVAFRTPSRTGSSGRGTKARAKKNRKLHTFMSNQPENAIHLSFQTSQDPVESLRSIHRYRDYGRDAGFLLFERQASPVEFDPAKSTKTENVSPEIAADWLARQGRFGNREVRKISREVDLTPSDS